MNTPQRTHPYKRHRFPAEIIHHCVWLSCRFCFSYRDVEALMTERGVTLTTTPSGMSAGSLANSMLHGF
jgi:transposase-like protein